MVLLVIDPGGIPKNIHEVPEWRISFLHRGLPMLGEAGGADTMVIPMRAAPTSVQLASIYILEPRQEMIGTSAATHP